MSNIFWFQLVKSLYLFVVVSDSKWRVWPLVWQKKQHKDVTKWSIDKENDNKCSCRQKSDSTPAGLNLVKLTVWISRSSAVFQTCVVLFVYCRSNVSLFEVVCIVSTVFLVWFASNRDIALSAINCFFNVLFQSRKKQQNPYDVFVLSLSCGRDSLVLSLLYVAQSGCIRNRSDKHSKTVTPLKLHLLLSNTLKSKRLL